MSWIRRLFARDSHRPEAERGRSPGDDLDAEIEHDDPPEVVEMPIEDSIDLHPFQPREVKDVVVAYLDEAWERGFEEVRIVHGRGIGQQRQTVRKVLERDPRVRSFADAGSDRGGWGATVARLAPRDGDAYSDSSES